MESTIEQGDTVRVCNGATQWRVDCIFEGHQHTAPFVAISTSWWPVRGALRGTDMRVQLADLTLVRKGYVYPVQPDPYA